MSLQHPKKKPGKAESAQNHIMARQTQDFRELISCERSWTTEFLVFLVTLGRKTVKEKDTALRSAVHRQAYSRPLGTHLPQPQAGYPERLKVWKRENKAGRGGELLVFSGTLSFSPAKLLVII